MFIYHYAVGKVTSVTNITVVRDKCGRFAKANELPVKVVDGSEFIEAASSKSKTRPSASAGRAPIQQKTATSKDVKQAKQPTKQNTATGSILAVTPPVGAGHGSDDSKATAMWPALENYANSKIAEVE